MKTLFVLQLEQGSGTMVSLIKTILIAPLQILVYLLLFVVVYKPAVLIAIFAICALLLVCNRSK
jgi:hypothetical protein